MKHFRRRKLVHTKLSIYEMELCIEHHKRLLRACMVRLFVSLQA